MSMVGRALRDEETPAGYGPVVMNTQAEIRQTIEDTGWVGWERLTLEAPIDDTTSTWASRMIIFQNTASKSTSKGKAK
jgi:hypothetical protein